jgi:hypothetical protein
MTNTTPQANMDKKINLIAIKSLMSCHPPVNYHLSIFILLQFKCHAFGLKVKGRMADFKGAHGFQTEADVQLVGMHD